jgi:hypothetical protein
MATCPSNAVISKQNVATGTLTCYDTNGAVIQTISGNSPVPVGASYKCGIGTINIKTVLSTNDYQCENSFGTPISTSNPCTTGWAKDLFTIENNGILSYQCSNPTGTSTPFSCPNGITPTTNTLTGLMTKCIIPARQSIPEPTSSSDVSSSDVSSSDISSSDVSSSDVSSSDLTSVDAPPPDISSSNSTSSDTSSNSTSSNSTSSNSTSSNSPSSSTASTNNIGFYMIIIGILITIIVIGVISYFVFFNNHSNKSIDIINKGGYYYFK